MRKTFALAFAAALASGTALAQQSLPSAPIPTQGGAAGLERFDGDGSGEIERDEASLYQFRRWDADGDGRLTGEELQAGTAGYPGHDGREMDTSAIDPEGDGITEEEFAEFYEDEAMFDRLDADSSGVIEEDELL